MARPWRIVDSIDTDQGLFDLQQRGEMDFLITIDSRVLINSSSNMFEIILADPAKLDQPVKNPIKIDQDKRGIEMEITYSQLVRKTKAPGRQIDIDHIKELSFL